MISEFELKITYLFTLMDKILANKLLDQQQSMLRIVVNIIIIIIIMVMV